MGRSYFIFSLTVFFFYSLSFFVSFGLLFHPHKNKNDTNGVMNFTPVVRGCRKLCLYNSRWQRDHRHDSILRAQKQRPERKSVEQEHSTVKKGRKETKRMKKLKAVERLHGKGWGKLGCYKIGHLPISCKFDIEINNYMHL